MITMSEYAKRRKELMRQVGADSIIIVPSAQEATRNADSHFPFRQNSDFYYLTGFNEPEAVLVLAPKRKAGEYILFSRVRNRAHEIWDGPRAGQEGAKKHYQAQQAFPIEQFKPMLPTLLAGRKTVHYPVGVNPKFDKLIMRAASGVRAKIRTGVAAPTEFVDIHPSVHEMRVIKSKAEVALMQKAADISAQAHLRAMQLCRPGMYEYQLEAELMHEFIRHGARFSAYTPIVGSGHNSCILHYVTNDKKIMNGDLVLVDAGAEFHNYAADITRTFPANGRFSSEQRAIYDLVLAAQMAAIKTVKPGASWTAAQQVIIKIITQGLVDLGLLKGRVDSLIEKEAYSPFYMHRSGHWLGLDVHDAGSYRNNGKWRQLKPGMVLTVEPGIYISADIPGVHKRWHNIGVRIEDDVLVTSSGNKVLSHAVPKKADEIEAVMAE